MTVICTVTKANDEAIKKPLVTSYHSFSIVNDLIVVRAELGGVRGNYILDTGSTGLLLNSVHHASIKVEDNWVEGASTCVESLQKHIDKFEFGNISKSNFSAMCLSLAHIESSMNIQIDGLIGMEILQGTAIIIDYESRMLMLADPSTDFSNADVVLDISLIFGIPVIQSKLNGQTFNLAIDFGATSSILDNSIADGLDLEVLEQIDLLTASGKTDALQKVTCKDLLLGDSFIFDTQAIIADLSHLQSKNQAIHGVVGLDILKAGKVLLNPSKGKLNIWTTD